MLKKNQYHRNAGREESLEKGNELQMLNGEEEQKNDCAESSSANLSQSKWITVRNGLGNGIDPLLRLKEVLEYIPVGRSTWYAGVKSGRYPAPVHHLGPRISAWTLSSIKRLTTGEGQP